MKTDPACEKCQHMLSRHCKAFQRHLFYKDELRQVRFPRTFICRGRHCMEPLCSCVDFERKAAA